VGAGQPVGGARVSGARESLVAAEFDQARVFGAVQRASGGDVFQERLQCAVSNTLRFVAQP
jgi:hypothetical protein